MAQLGPPVPVLRIFDEAMARDFYLGFLGFDVQFEHRFGDNFPLYLGIVRQGCVLHLSGHFGDAMPGAHLRVPVQDLATWAAELAAKDYRYAKPGPPQAKPWGTVELALGDPFGNRLTFVDDGGTLPT